MDSARIALAISWVEEEDGVVMSSPGTSAKSDVREVPRGARDERRDSGKPGGPPLSTRDAAPEDAKRAELQRALF
jgi:hypothetical protein